MKSIITTLITLALATGPLFAQDASDPSSHNHSAQQAEAATSQPAGQNEVSRIGDPWPLDTCVVSGEKLGSMGDPIIKLHEGREVRFCCKGCVGMFDKAPEEYLSKADEKIVETQNEHYPMDTCVVSGQPLGSMGEPITTVIGNRLMKFCCASCLPKAEAEPEKYIEKLDQAVIEEQAADYPLETCVISGQPLDSMGDPVNMVVANQLVQLCCAGCEKKVEADPAGTLAKINQAKGGDESHEGTSEKPHATEQKSEAAHGQHGHH